MSAAQIGTQIQAVRERAGLTQAELAEPLGVSQTAVSYWESGRRAPSLDTLTRIAQALDLTLVDLLGGLPPPEVRPGLMLAVDGEKRVVWKVPCLSVDMPHPGWMRLELEPDVAGGESTVTWWRVPDDVRLVEWQPGES